MMPHYRRSTAVRVGSVHVDVLAPGHPLSGAPMAMPGYMEAYFLRDGWTAHESDLLRVQDGMTPQTRLGWQS